MIEPLIENRTFDEIEVGDSVALERTLTWQDIELFAVMSGEMAESGRLDQEYARNDMFHGIVAHGMPGASLISALLGTRLPGPGTIYLEQTLRFHHPVSSSETETLFRSPWRPRSSTTVSCSIVAASTRRARR